MKISMQSASERTHCLPRTKLHPLWKTSCPILLCRKKRKNTQSKNRKSKTMGKIHKTVYLFLPHQLHCYWIMEYCDNTRSVSCVKPSAEAVLAVIFLIIQFQSALINGFARDRWIQTWESDEKRVSPFESLKMRMILAHFEHKSLQVFFL